MIYGLKKYHFQGLYHNSDVHMHIRPDKHQPGLGKISGLYSGKQRNIFMQRGRSTYIKTIQRG